MGGRNVWSSSINMHPTILSIADAKGGMMRQGNEFGRMAEKLLKKYNNTLPERYACSDTRHKFMYQKKDRKGTGKRKGKGKGKGKPAHGSKWYNASHIGIKYSKDATLAQ